jgi:hypothetical protein
MRKLDIYKAVTNLMSNITSKPQGPLTGLTQEKYENWSWNNPENKPPWSEVTQEAERLLRNTIANEIDEKTDELIEYGWTYNSQKVRLKLSDQTNIFQAYTNYSLLTFPFSMKVWSDDDGAPIMMVFNSSAELEQFYQEGFVYVHGILNSGFQLKESLKNLSGDSLINFIDNR